MLFSWLQVVVLFTMSIKSTILLYQFQLLLLLLLLLLLQLYFVPVCFVDSAVLLSELMLVVLQHIVVESV